MNLVYEQHGPRGGVEPLPVLGGGNNAPDVRDGAFHAAQPLELRPRGPGDHLGEARLAHTRRPVEQRGIEPVGVDGAAQQLARREQVRLSDVLVQRAGSHPSR